MKNQKTKTKEFINVALFLLLIGFAMGTVFTLLIDNKLESQLQSELQQCENAYFWDTRAEVIKGNLYVGYEDGVRVGFHQDYNGTWYRCARDCVVLEDRI